jgi:predicted RNA binding protein YcfA (HicA-like mRNA interferase family)
MTKLPVISGKKLLKLLQSIGFELVRIDGSHHFIAHPDGRYTTVPIHRNEDIERPLLRRILGQVGISIEEYLRLISR